MDSNSDTYESGNDARNAVRRRTVLATGAGLGIAGLLGTDVGSAGIGSSRDSGRGRGRPDVLTRSPLSENGLGNAQTDTPPFMPRLTTYNGRQYYAYWTHAGELVVAVRDLPDGDWQQNRMDIEIGTRDGHWTPCVGIGPQGNIFLNYNTRNSEIRWRRSLRPEDISVFGEERVGMTGRNESSATYLEFTRLRDGTLLEAHREGSSGSGNWIMNRWNADDETWEPLQHPLVSAIKDGYNSYMWNLVQSDDGVLHYFFNWRRTGGVQSNADLCYARSPDGGETWERSAGSTYDLPITLNTAEVVDPIEPNSNLINQGWASYDPRTGVPHVTYYRDDADGHTQVFHAYRDLNAEEWAIEPATERTTDIGLGGPGVVASPIGRMGIVVGDEGDVHILTRDYEHGGWPLLIEKLDGEWRTSILYKRNMTWSDIHIDRERWRDDRILSFVDHSQSIGNVPWSSADLIAITDIDLERIDRSTRTVDLSDDEQDITRYVATDPAETSLETTSTSFEDTSTALAFSETTVPASPMYARATADVETADEAAVEARIKVEGEHGTTLSEPATGGNGERVVIEWTEVPQAFRAGFANVQMRSNTDGSTAVLSNVMLELGYDDPTSFERTVTPQGSSGADNKPVAHMVPVDATGLQEVAPVTTNVGTYKDTPTSLDISRATPATPVYARVTARMEPYGDTPGLDGASWIWYPDDDPAWDVNESWAEGVRYFRRTFNLDRAPSTATLTLTADNLATVHINDEEVGTSADGFDGEPRYSWEHAPVLDVADALEAGENTIAIEVERFGHYAGLIGRLEATIGDETVTLNTDENWLAANEAPSGWRESDFDDSDWLNAQANGEYGLAPWGTNVRIEDERESAIRLAMTDESGETIEYGDIVGTDDRQIRTTGWERVSPEFNEGTVTLQAKDTRITAATLELAIRNEI